MSDNGYLDTLSSDYEESDSRMVLYIETLTGTAFELMVSPMDSVLSIKNKIQHDEGIPINQQHLLLGEKELSNSAYLEEEGITRGCTLRLVLGMRGGPISTRRASSRSEHLVWREIRDFVEATRYDMMTKVPPGSKITLLVYREGDTINLLKVIENDDGSYSPISDFRKPAIGRSRVSMRLDPEAQIERLREHTATMSKLTELRRKMEQLSVKKRSKQPKPESPLQPAQLETFNTGLQHSVDTSPSRKNTPTTASTTTTAHPSTVKTKTEKNYRVKKYQSFVGHLDTDKGKNVYSKNKVKQWLNSDYYDDPGVMPQKKTLKKSKHSVSSHSQTLGETKGNFYINKTYEMQAAAGVTLTDSSDEDDSVYRNRKYKMKPPPPPIKRISLPSRSYGDCLGPSTSSLLAGDTSTRHDLDNSSMVRARNADITIGDKTSKILAEYYPEVTHTDFRPSLSHRKPRLDEQSHTSGADMSLSERNCTSVHEASSIAILEEEPESNVGNEEPDFSTPAGPISVPSPDANTFTISQIPRERVSTATGTGSSRNRIRVARFVLKDDQRPKTSPDKFSREVCEFLLNDSEDTTKCYEPVNNEQVKASKLKFKRTKYISASNSKLDKLNNNSKAESSGSSACSWPRVSTSGKSQRLGLMCELKVQDRLKITKVDNILGSKISNPQEYKASAKRAGTDERFEHRVHKSLSGIRNKGFVENMENPRRDYEREINLHSKGASTYSASQIDLHTKSSSFKSDRRFMEGNELESKIVKFENTTSTIETLPPIEPVKKSTRIRCKKCNKRLNITTIHTCRCGDNFCSQHRYSEVHGCKYDYKTEGRKLIEQANPLVLASKLPKI